MHPLDYQPPAERNDGWQRMTTRKAIVLSTIVCLTPASIAAWAWITHWDQVRRNAVPMVPLTAGMIARDLTYLTGMCVGVTALAWLIGLGVARRLRTQ